VARCIAPKVHHLEITLISSIGNVQARISFKSPPGEDRVEGSKHWEVNPGVHAHGRQVILLLMNHYTLLINLVPPPVNHSLYSLLRRWCERNATWQVKLILAYVSDVSRDLWTSPILTNRVSGKRSRDVKLDHVTFRAFCQL